MHFFKDQVFWECDGNSACEAFQIGYPSADRSSFDITKRPIGLDLWPRMVFHYSGGRLTKSSDKLVAISGLARLVHAVTGDSYLAGLWRKNMEDQLCWSVINAAARIMPSTAPTWSWASLRGLISFPHYKEDRQLTGEKENIGQL